MLDFRAQAKRNQRKTLVLLSVATILLFAIYSFIAALGVIFFVGETPTEVHYIISAVGALVAAVITVVALYKTSDTTVLKIAGARKISTRNDGEFTGGPSNMRRQLRQEYRQVSNIVEEVAVAANVHTVETWVMDTPVPNAFATGTPKKGHIVFTTGLIELLNRRELQGVAAHEMGHIVNKDSQFISAVYGVSSILTGIGRGAGTGAKFGFYGSLGRKRGNSNLAAVVMVIMFLLWALSHIFSWIVKLVIAKAVSREREWMADATSVSLTRDPGGLRDALAKMKDWSPVRDDGVIAPTEELLSVGHLGINKVDVSMLDTRKKSWSWGINLDSHPPIEERISRLGGAGGL